MIHIILDCGGTSSECVCIRERSIVDRHSLPGYNAFTHNVEDLEEILQQSTKVMSEVDRISIYASGMTKEQSLLHNAHFSNLQRFKDIKLFFYSDLMLCAHAGFIRDPIVVGILGTGSNVGSFDGHQLTRKHPALGYVLTDYGSGVDIGKRLFYYLTRSDNQDLDTLKSFCPSLANSLSFIYESHQSAKSFFSKLTAFISNLEIIPPAVDDLISRAFDDYVSQNLLPELEVYASKDVKPSIFIFGSVGHYFERQLHHSIAKFTSLELHIAQYPLDVYLSKLTDS